MALWDDYFTEASWDGAAWFQGDFSDGDLSPEDVLCHNLAEFLKLDSRMSQIFGERIEVMDARPGVGRLQEDLRQMPRIYVYTGVTDREHQISDVDDSTIRVYLSVAFFLGGMGPVTTGHATTSSVLHWLVRAVHSTTDNSVTKKWHKASISGQDRDLVHNFGVVPHQTIYEYIETARDFVVMQEVQVECEVDVDRRTGRFQSIVRAGG